MNKSVLIGMLVLGRVVCVTAAPCKPVQELKPGETCALSFVEKAGVTWKHAVDKQGVVFVKYRVKRSVAKKGARPANQRVFTIKALKPGAVTVSFSEKSRAPKKAVKSAAKKYKITVARVKGAAKPAAKKATKPAAKPAAKKAPTTSLK